MSRRNIDFSQVSAELIAGVIRPERLQAAWRTVCATHDLLRVLEQETYTEGQLVVTSELPPLDLLTATPDEAVNAALSYWRARKPPFAVLAALVRHDDALHTIVISSSAAILDMGGHVIVREELGAAYAAAVAGAPWTSQLSSFADAVARETARAEEHKQLVRATAQSVADAVKVVELPNEKMRPAFPSLRAKTVPFDVPSDLSTAVHKLATSLHVSEESIYFSCLATLVTRYMLRRRGEFRFVMGRRLVASGTRVAAVGAFETTAPVVVDTSGAPTLRDLIMRVAQTTAEADRLAGVPVARILEEERLSSAANPAWTQVVFGFYERAGLAAGLETQAVDVSRTMALADLDVALVKCGEVVSGFIHYAEDVIEEHVAQQIATHYVCLLSRIAEDVSTPIDLVDYMAQNERERILYVWNATDRRTSEPRLTHRMFEQMVVLQGERPAVISGDRTMTYAELNLAANKLARYMRGKGVNTGQRVAVAVDRGPQLVVALLAVMKTGAAYVPIDMLYPRDRIRLIFDDARISLILTDASMRERIPEVESPVVDIDAEAEAIGEQDGNNLAGGATPEHAAYVIYTSGSTGTPKGVSIPHGALAEHLVSMAHEPGIGPSDTLMAVTTVAFDIAALELYLPLTRGARVLIVPREVVANGAQLRELCERTRPTMLQGTPSMWRMLIEANWPGDTKLTALVGGEPLPRALADQLLARCGVVWNMYGPTETTVWSTIWRVQAGTRVLIGRPIANTYIYVLDRAGQPVPVGVAGDLFIGGATLAHGYFGKPELTAEKFIANPFVPGTRMYNTGDIARLHADGSIEHLGRSDLQVKVRGYRIELGEIESRIDNHPAVKTCVVAVTRDSRGEARLVAYLVPRGEPPTREDVQAFISTTLPPYMVPSAFSYLPELPLTPNGKVDRRALADAAATPLPTKVVDEPLDAFEESIATIWRSVLNVTTIGPSHNFFELGGHSLLVIRVQAKLEALLGRKVSITTLFEQVTLRALGQALRDDGSGAAANTTAADARGAQRRSARNLLRRR